MQVCCGDNYSKKHLGEVGEEEESAPSEPRDRKQRSDWNPRALAQGPDVL